MFDPMLDVVIIEASVMILITAIVLIAIMRKTPSEKRIRHTPSLQTIATTDIKDLVTTVQKLQLEKDELRHKLWKYERKPSRKAGLILLLFGGTLLMLSIIFTSSILAYVGLGLTFWGVLLLFMRSVRYVKGDLLDATTISSLATIDKIITDLNYRGKGIYLPPRKLKELKEGRLFISAKEETVVPAVEELSQEKAFINPHGLYLTPLGQGLVNLFEKELGTELFKTDLDYLQSNLPKLLIEDLELLKDFDMTVNGNMIHVTMSGSVYSNLCDEVRKLTNICSHIGCPICSAIACTLARVTGRAVTIEKNEFHPDDTIETWYRLMEG